VLCAVLTACAGTAACTDPTESNVVLSLRNDLSFRVVVSPCGDARCHRLAGTVRNHMAPGDNLPVNVSADRVPTYYSVLAESGGPARCLTVAVSTKPVDPVVRLSAAQDCESR